jgi:hypothetical protein
VAHRATSALRVRFVAGRAGAGDPDRRAQSDCAFEWAAHIQLGRQAGVQKEAIEVIAGRGPLELCRPTTR